MVKINKPAVMTGLGGLVLGYAVGLNVAMNRLPSMLQQTEDNILQKSGLVYTVSVSPTYRFAGQDYVAFRDNLSVGMKAFAEYQGKTFELKSNSQQEDYAAFTLPEELLKAKEFIVYAIDRDGNRSQPKTLFTIDGIIVEQMPTSG